MTGRDRLVVSIIVALAALAGMYLLVVSPKRKEATSLGKQLSSAQSTLSSAESQVAQGRAAALQYSTNLRNVTAIFRAVPADSGVPQLLVALDRTSHNKRVDFRVVNVSSSASGGPSASPTTPSTGAAASGFQPLSFTFTFAGDYIALQRFLNAVDHYARVEGGKIVAYGRLLTIQSVGLTPSGNGGATASVTATAYSEQSGAASSAGATPAAPGSATTPGTQGAGSTGASTSSAPAQGTPVATPAGTNTGAAP
jgi:hypothetical protein